MALNYPQARGRRYGYSSIELTFILPSGAEVIQNVNDISYSDTLEEELQYGTDQAPLGRSPGQYTPGEASFVLEAQTAAVLIDRLGDGWMDQTFDVTVTYSDVNLPVLVDTLEQCRIIGSENAHSQGPGVLMRSFTLKPMTVLSNGKTPLTNHVR